MNCWILQREKALDALIAVVLVSAILLSGLAGCTPAGQGHEYQQLDLPATPIPNDIGALVFINGGKFMMGAPDDAEQSANSPRPIWIDPARPCHEEVVPSFEIGKYPVTASEYCAFLNEVRGREDVSYRTLPYYPLEEFLTKRRFRQHPAPGGYSYTSPEAHPYIYIHYASTVVAVDGTYHPRPGYECAPAIDVPYRGARQYCQWLSEKTGDTYRLPSEIEWEYAARGSEGRTYPWGEESPVGRAYLLLHYEAHENSWFPGMTYVGRFPNGATPEGVHDLMGNARQWCGNYYYRYTRDSIGKDPRKYRDFVRADLRAEGDEQHCETVSTERTEEDDTWTVTRGGQYVDWKRAAVATAWMRYRGGAPDWVGRNGTSFRVLREVLQEETMRSE